MWKNRGNLSFCFLGRSDENLWICKEDIVRYEFSVKIYVYVLRSIYCIYL